MNQDIRPRRSALYLPASNAKAMEKARTLAADIIILDLEDAVAPEAKEGAREAAVAAIRQGGFGDREVAIRVNARNTPWGIEDLRAAVTTGADAILVPKVNTPEDITAYSHLIETAPARTRLWAMIETCACLPRLDAIAAMAETTRLSLFVMGTNDLAREMRARLTADRTPFLPVLTLAIAAARAHGVAILDGVCNEFRDLSALSAEAEQALCFGFDGKTLIHPDQIGPCNMIFSPSVDELAWADAVIDAFSLPENAGKGAIKVEGKMAELLHLDQARQLKAIAAAVAARG